MRSWPCALRLCRDPNGLSPELITSSLISPLMPQPGARAGLPGGSWHTWLPAFMDAVVSSLALLALHCVSHLPHQRSAQGRERESFMLSHSPLPACVPRQPGKPLAGSLKARSYQHCSGVRKVSWGQHWGDRGHHGKSHFAEGSAWEDKGWCHRKGAAHSNAGCVSPPNESPLSSVIPFILLSLSEGWDTEKIFCIFPCTTAGRKFFHTGNFAKVLGNTLEGVGRAV